MDLLDKVCSAYSIKLKKIVKFIYGVSIQCEIPQQALLGNISSNRQILSELARYLIKKIFRTSFNNSATQTAINLSQIE